MNADSSELLGRYDFLRRISQQMLESAQRDEWDKLIELEQGRASIVGKLKQDDTVTWQAGDAQKKADLIRAILAIETQIRNLGTRQMEQLQKALGNVGTEIKLNKAYGAI